MDARRLSSEVVGLVLSDKTPTDIHIEEGQPVMVKTACGQWEAVEGMSPVSIEDMTPLLVMIDEEWWKNTVGRTIDRPVTIATHRLHCSVFRVLCASRIVIMFHLGPARPCLPIAAQAMSPLRRALVMGPGAMDEEPTKDGIKVKRGQVWRDLKADRHWMVSAVRGGKAILHHCDAEGRLVDSLRVAKIQVARMHRSRRGWRREKERGLTKRSWTYVLPPREFDVAPCDCGNAETQWSEYEDRCWCPRCQKDFLPRHMGVFWGDDPLETVARRGLCFDRVVLATQQIKVFDTKGGKYRPAVASWAVEAIKRLEADLASAYCELRKQRPAIDAVFDPAVWDRASATAEHAG